jgi:hypothetical protein
VSDDGPHQEKQISGVEAKGSDQRAMIKKIPKYSENWKKIPGNRNFHVLSMITAWYPCVFFLKNE